MNGIRNKLRGNADHFPTKENKIGYVRSRVDDDAVKHIRARLKPGHVNEFKTAEEVLDVLVKVYGDSDKEGTALKKFSQLRQSEKFREFFVFWAEFQRLAHEVDHSEKTLLNELRLKMSFELQKALKV